MSATEKKCSVCGQIKPLSEFYTSKYPPGHVSQCKPCDRERHKRYRENNPEKYKRQQKAYKDKNRDVLNARRQAYRENNPEKIKEQGRRLYEKSAEKRRQQRRDYYRAHRNEIEAARRRNYPSVASKVQARNAATYAARKGILPRVNDLMCNMCGGPATQYHHESYEKDCRLDVVPVCAACHGILHRDD